MFAEAIEEILEDACTPAVVRAIESGASPRLLWDAVAEAGYLELLAAEEAGGAGLSLHELFPILAMLGRRAVPVPIAQSIAARALLSSLDAVPSGMITFASGLSRSDDGGLVSPLTPFGTLADHVLGDDGGDLLLLACADAQRVPTGVHGSLAATLSWSREACAHAPRLAGQGAALRAYGAAIHAALMAGAMGRVFELTMQYANDRVQFGKSIGKFQSIQHQLSVMAEHVAASSIAAEAAFHGDAAAPSLPLAAIAKSRTSEAALLVASIAHAVHGAIGVTEEFDLQLLTRRLHEWRIAHGSEAYWNLVVARDLMSGAWPAVSDYVRAVGA